MQREKDLELLLQYVKRIDSKLTHIITKQAKPKETWIKATELIKLTGWSHEEMRTARKNGYVQYKRDSETGFWYLVESISPVFLKINSKEDI